MTDTATLTTLKAAHRRTWASGDYDIIASQIWDVGASIVRHARVEPGNRVLDVACGTGNAAVRAAQAGAEVVGVDLTPELFDAGRARAAAAGVEVRWEEGDAEELPYGDAEFDVVLSTFGAMFAPRHQAVAGELARVLRPGGRLGMANWTPAGFIGQLLRTVSGFLPAPPPFASPPPRWGSDDHVRELFAPTGLRLETFTEVMEFRWEGVDQAVEVFTGRYGPLLTARSVVEPQGRWPEFQAALHDLFARWNTATDDTFRCPGEYLVLLGHRPD